MSKTRVTAKTGKHKPMTCHFDFGSSLDDRVKRFGPEVIDGLVMQSLTSKVQGIIRIGQKEGRSEVQIQKDLDTYKPGLHRRGRTEAEKLALKFGKMEESQKKVFLAGI